MAHIKYVNSLAGSTPLQFQEQASVEGMGGGDGAMSDTEDSPEAPQQLPAIKSVAEPQTDAGAKPAAAGTAPASNVPAAPPQL